MQFISSNRRLFSRTYPSPANAVDVFADGWASNLPEINGVALKAGSAKLFDDERIRWANEGVGGFHGMKVLELGPLEGGHSYMLQEMGADSILAIEANSRQFLKCLIVKELYRLDKCEFLLGDFVKYMESAPEKFDFCLASGVLYHMEKPIELISLISRITDRTLIWTQYYDHAKVQKNMPFYKRSRFSPGKKRALKALPIRAINGDMGLD